MRKFAVSLLFAFLALAVLNAGRLHAFPPFFKAFNEQYIAKHKDKKFAEYVTKEVKCYVCHQGKKVGPHRNPYGKNFEKLLTKKDIKNADKINAALEKVGKMHSDPKNDKSPTYDELIAESKLPSGMKLEDLKKDPPKKEGEKEEEHN
jgi:hypothetical protein